MSIEAVNLQLNQNRLKEQLVGKAIEQANSSNKDIDQTRLKGAVKELEALFIYEMLKEMRQATQGDFLGKGMGSDIYNSLFDMEVAKLYAERGIGLGDLILKQMTNHEGARSKGPKKNSSNPLENGKISSLEEGIFPPTSSSSLISPATTQSIPLERPQVSSLKLKEEIQPPASPTASRPEGEPSGIKEKSEVQVQSKLPVEGRISSPYGWREDPFSGQEKFHAGIDIATPSGQEVYPIRKGQVIFSGLTKGYGNIVIIAHEDGFFSKYSHNLTNLVSVGDNVTPDKAIALTGNTGRSTGPHLHFEVQYKGKSVDPLELVRSQPGAIG